MSLSHEHVGSKIPAKINTFMVTSVELLIHLFHEIPCMIYFKAFGMINLHYEIRICQKIYNRVTMTVHVKCVV